MQRNVALDYFKILLSAMVVAIHAEVMGNNYFLVDGLFRIAVPIFFIINGYFFFYKVYNKEKLLQWGRRVLVLYLFWMLFYLPLYFTKIDGVGGEYMVNLFSTFFFGYRHLWYIPAMFLGGVFIYFIRNIKVYSFVFLIF